MLPRNRKNSIRTILRNGVGQTSSNSIGNTINPATLLKRVTEVEFVEILTNVNTNFVTVNYFLNF